jgi:hypothetical protein
MAPEQAQAMEIDSRADLFSLGSVLYTLCTGRSPFRADTAIGSLRRVCDEPHPPIRELAGQIPAGLERTIARLLEKDPADRIQTATEVVATLRSELAQTSATHDELAETILTPVTIQRSGATLRTRAWLVTAVTFLLLTATETTGLTRMAATVIQIVRGDGTILIEVDDPTVDVTVDDDHVVINEKGTGNAVVAPGTYTIHVGRNGRPVEERTVTIKRRGRQTVRFTFIPTKATVARVTRPARDLEEPVNLPAESWTEPARLWINEDDSLIYGRPSVSGDGLILIFESDMDGGHGELDLWMTTRDSINEEFQVPVNLGPEVNTSEREMDPAVSADALTLVFSSKRDGGFGRTDFWIATRESKDKPFRSAENLGRK